MSRKIELVIESLVHDDMDGIVKMKKSQLLQLVKELKTDNYREMLDESLIEIYDDRFGGIFK
jgi:hypothetical protein